ncbi:hypothetical protein Hanom_Chr15g01387751 [Helianthus anomalus]
MDKSLGNSVYFFNSADQDLRPNKRYVKIRPRCKAHPKPGQSSPISGERPKKRPREEGTFNFDLNVAANIGDRDCSQTEEVLVEDTTDPVGDTVEINQEEGSLNHVTGHREDFGGPFLFWGRIGGGRSRYLQSAV